MRIARFSRDDDVAYGVVQEVSPDGAGGAAPGQDAERLQVAELHGHPFGVGSDSVRFTGARYPLPEVRLLAPVLPTKVIAIGKNYADHAREMGAEPPSEPVIFLKPSTAVTGPGDPVARPVKLSERVDLELTTTVNGEVKQQARTSQLRHDVTELICYVTAVMTLLPGDVLLTGTPAGVGPLAHGDNVPVTIQGIGTLSNRVVDRD